MADLTCIPVLLGAVKMVSKNPNVQLLTVSEVAEFLRLSRSSVYQMVERGILATYRVGFGRGAIRLSREELLRYVESCRTLSAGAARIPLRRKSKLRHLKL
jgi:excisionase family DNA binding protein